MKKSMLVQVMSKGRIRLGKVYPAELTDYSCEIIPNESISIFKKGVLCNTFKIGDQAEYGSYNLSYYGEIVSVSPKAVSIVAYKGCNGMEKKKMLSLNEFCWRNEDFDLAYVKAKNSEEMMCI